MSSQLFESLFTYAAQTGASDIHLRAGSSPMFRIKGDLANVKSPALQESQMEELCKYLQKNSVSPVDVNLIQELDGSFEIPGKCRLRYNIFRYDGKLGAVLRVLNMQVPTLDQLGLPPVMKKIAATERGLVLVTGPTGSGKSTTLASMIEEVNLTQRTHILTIEDPIEYVYASKNSRITQREIGRDTKSFALAVRAALRQDPDTILIGEIRDLETLDIALKAAETGHTVFSTVHTNDAAKTINRLVSMFSPEEQKNARVRIADALQATISQRPVRRADKKGIVMAQEIMIRTHAIWECIVDPNRASEMTEFIAQGHDVYGSQTFDQHLLKLYQAGTVSLQVAKESATNPADFERNLKFRGDHAHHEPDGKVDHIQLEESQAPETSQESEISLKKVS